VGTELPDREVIRRRAGASLTLGFGGAFHGGWREAERSPCNKRRDLLQAFYMAAFYALR